jgi:hypothetical protein
MPGVRLAVPCLQKITTQLPGVTLALNVTGWVAFDVEIVAVFV